MCIRFAAALGRQLAREDHVKAKQDLEKAEEDRRIRKGLES